MLRRSGALGFEATQASTVAWTQGLQDGDLEKNLVDVSMLARADAINSLLSKVRLGKLLAMPSDGLRKRLTTAGGRTMCARSGDWNSFDWGRIS